MNYLKFAVIGFLLACTSVHSQFQIIKVQGNFAVVNGGAAAEIKYGQKLQISRRLESGYVFNIGTAEVVKVLADRAAVKMIKFIGNSSIRVGDLVSPLDNKSALGFNDEVDVKSKSMLWGVKAGLNTLGTSWINDREFDMDGGSSFGVFLDYQLGPKITGGLLFDTHEFGGDDAFLDFSMTLKALLAGKTGGFALKPGLGFGYGQQGDSQFLTIRGTLEAVIAVKKPIFWIAEIGVYASPAGGDADVDLTFTTLLVRTGLAF